MNLNGKTVLVTHTSDPLGSEIAARLQEHGASIVGATHLQQPDHFDVGYPMLTYDIMDPESVGNTIAGCVATAGNLDAAIIVPEMQERMRFLDQTPEDWERALKLNTAGMFHVGQAVARHMVESKTAGRIVYVSSVVSEMAFYETSLFSTTLAAVNTIARVAAIELGEYGISVNVVAPAWYQSRDGTELHFGGAAFPDASAKDVAYIAQGTPLRRVASVDEIADLCGFLLTDTAGYISGAYLPIDGAYAITKTEGNTPYPGGKPWQPYDSGYDPRTTKD